MLVGQLADTLELSIGATVHTHLNSLVASHLAGHDGDLTRQTRLLVLHGSHSAHNGGGEGLASIIHLLGSLVTSSLNVLHGLREARVREGSLLGDPIVDGLDGASKRGIGAGTVPRHIDVKLAELAAGTTLRGADRGGHLAHGGVPTL